MTKNELINYIRNCRKKMKLIDEYDEKINSLTRINVSKDMTLDSDISIFKAILFTPVGSFIIWVIIYIIPKIGEPTGEFLMMCVLKCLKCFTNYTGDKLEMATCLWAIVIIPEILVVSGIIIDRIRVKIKNREINKKYEFELEEARRKVKNNQPKVNECNNIIFKLNNELNTMMQKNIIPRTYFNYTALTKFDGYLCNNRADTLRECINLFHVECNQQEIRNLMEDYNRQLDRVQAKQNQIESDIASLSDDVSQVDSDIYDIHDRLNM